MLKLNSDKTKTWQTKPTWRDWWRRRKQDWLLCNVSKRRRRGEIRWMIRIFMLIMDLIRDRNENDLTLCYSFWFNYFNFILCNLHESHLTHNVLNFSLRSKNFWEIFFFFFFRVANFKLSIFKHKSFKYSFCWDQFPFFIFQFEFSISWFFPKTNLDSII